MLANMVCNRLRPGTRIDGIRFGGQRRPEWRVAAREKGDRRGSHRCRSAFGAIRPCVARPQPRPGDMTGKAPVIEPKRLIAGETCREDFGFPGARRRLETFELCDNRI